MKPLTDILDDKQFTRLFFGIPGASPEWQRRTEQAFNEVLASIPKPATPEPENAQ